VQITCYDRNGNEVKRVTSSDDGTVEDGLTPDPSNDSLTPNPSPNGEGSENQGGGTNNGGGDNGGGDDNGGSDMK
jgi:hypothetical protein